MGHSSKKKKRGGAGGSGKKKKPLKDHGESYDNELLSEEITALSAIFQDDCKIVSGSQPQIIIKLRPHSKDMGYEDLDVSALLTVRCLPGYPNKCPKLQITPEKGLSITDADKLLSLINDQASSNAREGRVMIFNLVEAAQEFLSEIVPVGQSQGPVTCSTADSSAQLFQNDAAVSSSKKGPFVYGFIDLFSGSGKSWSWSFEVNETKGINSSVQLPRLDGSKLMHEIQENKLDKEAGPLKSQEIKQASVISPNVKLETLEEESEDSKKSNYSVDSSGFLLEEMDGNSEETENENSVPEEDSTEDDWESRSQQSDSLSLTSLAHDQGSQNIKRDLIMVHLLRLACTKGPLADALPQITTELQNIGVLSEWAGDLATKPISLLNRKFNHAFGQHMVSSRISKFWELTSDLEEPSTSLPSSRYLNDFEELHSLGHGGFGHVVLCKNKLDGRQYAVKKIRLKDKSLPLNDRILREVATLSRLQHQHVVRYYQEVLVLMVILLGVQELQPAPLSALKVQAQQMILGMRINLNQHICTFKWSTVLAKFLKFEQLDQDPIPADTTGVSLDGTGQVGTYFYTAPEIEQGWPKIDEKADMYSLGIVFLELWHPFGTAMERHLVLSDLKQKGVLPSAWVAEYPEQASLLRLLMSPSPSDRPSATELIKHAFPPRMESELLDNILRTMQTSEDRTVYDKVLNAIFDEEMLSLKDQQHHDGRLRLAGGDTSAIQYSDLDTEARDYVVEITREVFRQHCAKHLEVIPMRLLDDCQHFMRNTVKLLTHGGDMLELLHELRLPFVSWVISNQKSSFKRYEISCVYRRPIGHASPSRYLQGDFDIIGGASALTEAEVIKVTRDIVTRFFHSEFCDIHLNHGDLLEAIWSWVGVKADHRQKVAELLSMMGSLRPQSSERKSKWVVIRRQLLQELNLQEAVVNRLQTVGLRFCGAADQALPRLRGALPNDKPTRTALDELSDLCNYLRAWRIEGHVYIDPLIPPTESYHRDLFFQVYLVKDSSPGSPTEGALLAIGGRNDYLLHHMWGFEHKSSPPGSVGTSLALETIIQHYPVDFRPISRNETSSSVLVCSKGGGGLLAERMELVNELWEENIKAEFLPTPDPSLTEQYEYANEHDIKCLVIITDTGVSQKGSVKVRHLELKKEKEVEREFLVRFLLDAVAIQFKNPSIWY
uniref:probable serine/threonine-protein kinase GCN2 isoform X3 n=1 Tax=Fragaria vesca subsp. vesca TaxID=101020 RepID=UPI0005C8F60A|nr:PREDICTED: probable serine/threonine-protein kinase GCN2 isoform X3 [Fragaria vesca subsp. vesca]